MAKSFRNVLTPVTPVIPTSKKDILDFINEGQTGNELPKKSTSVVTPIINTLVEESNDVRQTFILSKVYLDKIKDYVFTKRKNGEIYYNQKNALHDALDLLFKDFKMETRPESVREFEESRNNKIRKGLN